MLAAVTAVVVGVIAHLALWFGWRLLAEQQWPAAVVAVAIAAVTSAGLSRWRWPLPAVVPAAGLAGAVTQALIPVAA